MERRPRIRQEYWVVKDAESHLFLRSRLRDGEPVSKWEQWL
jgi:hypothetical protein